MAVEAHASWPRFTFIFPACVMDAGCNNSLISWMSAYLAVISATGRLVSRASFATDERVL